MSGFVVLFNPDGAPVDGDLLANLTGFLAERGPDAQKVWRAGPIGMGHTLLRTTWEAAYEAQPLTVGHDVWMVADARVDGREDLWQKLGRPGDAKLAETADSALILHAYLKWGEQCVDHLIGDFSFVVWDCRSQRLFGAKDHFGVRLLYHTRIGNTWVISNVLDCVRLHPGVSDQLNEQTVIDFLLFDCNQELDTTIFAAIGKLPSAHTFTVAKGTFRSRRYWEIPEPDIVFRKRNEDYIEGFRELLQQATSDRLRTDKASVWLSGGLDSTNMAAAALEAGRKRGRPVELKAITGVYDRLIPDRERHFASRAAEALGISIEFIVADDIPLFEGWDRPERKTSEPQMDPTAGVSWRAYHAAARHGRVVLYGEGADEILPTWNVRQLFRHLRLVDLGCCVVESVFGHRRLPPLGTRVIANWKKLVRRDPEDKPRFPEWLAADLAAREDVRERFQRLTHPVYSRSKGRCASRFLLALWTNIMELDAEKGASARLEVCLPYLDLRLLSFALTLPPFPWSANKFLLRQLGKGALPVEILCRPKTGLADDPCEARLPSPAAWEELQVLVPMVTEMEDFVTLANWRVAITRMPQGLWPTWSALRPISLAAWLQNGRSSSRPPSRGGPARH
jgi:asparagine synthase (glutamine-hydrolysing)